MSEPGMADLRKVARLARLDLSDGELARLGSDVREILVYVEKIQDLDVDGVVPTSHPHAHALVNVFGDDEPQPSLSREDALANAPEAEGGFFKVLA